MDYYSGPDIINFPFIDYIIHAYVPDIRLDTKKYEHIQMHLFRQAMCHQSASWVSSDPSYERLEYLGDSIFHLIATEYIYDRYEDEGKGFLTKLRIKLDRSESMVELTNILELNRYIQYRNIYLNDNILEDVFESFIGAFYLNFGMGHTRKFIIELLERHKDFAMLIYLEDNYKDLLLQYFHKMKYNFPKYIESYDQYGNYVSTVKTPFGKVLGIGISKNKKKSEQLASKHALTKVQILIGDNIDPDWIEKIDLMTNSKEEIKVKKADENKLSVYNPNNKLMGHSDIKEILQMYNTPFPSSSKTKFKYKIFHEAQTHKSYLKRKNLTDHDKECAKKAVPLQRNSNERLQLLGDSVIHFIIGEHLYLYYPERDEGFMTRLRCKLENRNILFKLAKQIGLDKYVLLSQNIDVLYGNRDNVNIVGGVLEAFVGALYLELGLGTARQFMLEVLRLELDIDQLAETETNYKEIISQLYIKSGWGIAKYEILKKEGPDHKIVFTMGLVFNGKIIGRGTANSKKGAEQIAAKKGYMALQNN